MAQLSLDCQAVYCSIFRSNGSYEIYIYWNTFLCARSGAMLIILPGTNSKHPTIELGINNLSSISTYQFLHLSYRTRTVYIFLVVAQSTLNAHLKFEERAFVYCVHTFQCYFIEKSKVAKWNLFWLTKLHVIESGSVLLMCRTSSIYYSSIHVEVDVKWRCSLPN